MGYSMTGYGQGEAIRPERRIMVEIKSVNSRYRDISFRLPRSLSSLEPPLRELINKCVNRGKVDVRVEYDSYANSGTQIKLDRDLALSYLAAYAELEELTKRLLPDPTGNLAQISGLFTVSTQETDPAEIWPQIEEATDAALDQFMSMRRNEGEMLCRDLRYKIEQLTEQLSAVSLRAETVPQEQKNVCSKEWKPYSVRMRKNIIMAKGLQPKSPFLLIKLQSMKNWYAWTAISDSLI